MTPRMGGVVGANLVAPTVTMTIHGPYASAIAASWVWLRWTAHAHGQVRDGSVQGAERGLGPHAGGLLPRLSGTFTVVTGQSLTVHVTSKQTNWP